MLSIGMQPILIRNRVFDGHIRSCICAQCSFFTPILIINHIADACDADRDTPGIGNLTTQAFSDVNTTTFAVCACSHSTVACGRRIPLSLLISVEHMKHYFYTRKNKKHHGVDTERKNLFSATFVSGR